MNMLSPFDNFITQRVETTIEMDEIKNVTRERDNGANGNMVRQGSSGKIFQNV